MNRNKGFSLVELICTVAVMGVILTSISGAMIIASHNYTNGTVNVELQQETQTTSNLLSNLVIDSKTLDVSGLTETGDSDGTIKITATDESLVTIAYDTATKELTYSKQLTDGSIEDGILASGVTYFYADASSYSVDKNVYFTMGLSDFNDDKEFKTSFSVTSRNITLKNDYSSMAAISAKRFAIIEPGQTLNLPCKVLESSEGYTVGAVTGATDSNTSVAPLDGEHVLIRCGGDEKAVSFYFDVETVERRVDADGNVTSDPVDKKVIQVNVRRVTDIRIITQSETTFDNTADRIYVIKAELIGNNLEKQDYAYGDEDYVSPYKIDFRVLGTGSFCGSGYGGWNNYFNGEGDTLRVSGQRVEYRFKKVGRDVDKTKYADPSNIKFTIRVRAWHTYGYTDSIAWFGQEPSNKTRLTYYGNDLKDSLNILNADTDGGSTNERVLINYENAHSSELLYKDVVFKFKDSNEEIGVFSHPSALRRGERAEFNVDSSKLDLAAIAQKLGVSVQNVQQNLRVYRRARVINPDGSFGAWSAFEKASDNTNATVNSMILQPQDIGFDSMALKNDYQIEMVFAYIEGGKVIWPNYDPLITQYGASQVLINNASAITKVNENNITSIGSRVELNKAEVKTIDYSNGKLKIDCNDGLVGTGQSYKYTMAFEYRANSGASWTAAKKKGNNPGEFYDILPGGQNVIEYNWGIKEFDLGNLQPGELQPGEYKLVFSSSVENDWHQEYYFYVN